MVNHESKNHAMRAGESANRSISDAAVLLATAAIKKGARELNNARARRSAKQGDVVQAADGATEKEKDTRDDVVDAAEKLTSSEYEDQRDAREVADRLTGPTDGQETVIQASRDLMGPSGEQVDVAVASESLVGPTTAQDVVIESSEALANRENASELSNIVSEYVELSGSVRADSISSEDYDAKLANLQARFETLKRDPEARNASVFAAALMISDTNNKIEDQIQQGQSEADINVEDTREQTPDQSDVVSTVEALLGGEVNYIDRDSDREVFEPAPEPVKSSGKEVKLNRTAELEQPIEATLEAEQSGEEPPQVETPQPIEPSVEEVVEPTNEVIEPEPIAFGEVAQADQPLVEQPLTVDDEIAPVGSESEPDKAAAETQTDRPRSESELPLDREVNNLDRDAYFDSPTSDIDAEPVQDNAPHLDEASLYDKDGEPAPTYAATTADGTQVVSIPETEGTLFYDPPIDNNDPDNSPDGSAPDRPDYEDTIPSGKVYESERFTIARKGNTTTITDKETGNLVFKYRKFKNGSISIDRDKITSNRDLMKNFSEVAAIMRRDDRHMVLDDPTGRNQAERMGDLAPKGSHAIAVASYVTTDDKPVEIAQDMEFRKVGNSYQVYNRKEGVDPRDSLVAATKDDRIVGGNQDGQQYAQVKEAFGNMRSMERTHQAKVSSIRRLQAENKPISSSLKAEAGRGGR